MPSPAPSAHVRSVEAIDHFRSALTVYGGKARPLIEDAWDEAGRTREWLRHDRRVHWENEVRRRRRKLDDAQQALFSARFSTLKQVSAAEQIAVQRARRALAEAEAKLEKTRHWAREFDDRVAPMLKQLEEVRTHLTTGLGKASAYLSQTVRALEAYTSESAAPAALPSAPPDPAPPGPEEPQS